MPKGVVLVLSMLAISGRSIETSEATRTSCLTSGAATRTEHISVWLSGMPEEASPTHPFYVATEGDGSGRFEVRAGAHVCGEQASVRYVTTNGTATRTTDFRRRVGVAEFVIVHVADPVPVDVPILRDGVVEAPLESFRVVLSRPRNGSLRAPSEAPFHILDVDGADRATLDGDPYLVSESVDPAQIAVFRAGPATGTMNVPFLVQPTGETPATEGSDYTVMTEDPLVFEPGERVEVIEIAVADDALEEADETLEVVLTEAKPDALARTTVTIDGALDVSPPRSRFHHPKEGWDYASEDFRIREVHVFTGDANETGVARMSIALRRNSTGGACAWWDGNGFDPGACSEPRWVRMRAYEAGWFYFYRLDPLRPSVGTNVRSYTAFAQGTDAAGNVEQGLIRGRNRNTFEVTRG